MGKNNTNISYIKYIKRGIKINANTIPSHIGNTQIQVDLYDINSINIYNNLKVGDVAYMLPSSLKREHITYVEYFIKYIEKCLKQKTNKLHCKKVLINDKYLILRYYKNILFGGFFVSPKVNAIPLIGNKEINTKFFLPNMYFLTEMDYQRYIIEETKAWLKRISTRLFQNKYDKNLLTYYRNTFNTFIERFKIT